MNGKTAKLINRYARLTGREKERRAMKRVWSSENTTPTSKHRLRTALKSAVRDIRKGMAKAKEEREASVEVPDLLRVQPRLREHLIKSGRLSTEPPPLDVRDGFSGEELARFDKTKESVDNGDAGE